MSVKLYIGWCYVGRPSTSFTNIILVWKFRFSTDFKKYSSHQSAHTESDCSSGLWERKKTIFIL